MNDHELTVLVDRAASGMIDSHAAIHGSVAWADLDAGRQNEVREAALPFIFHGSKALAELGYSKPRIIATRDELDALPDRSVVIDTHGDVSQLRSGDWCGYETAPLDSRTLAKYLPATVIHEPSA